MSGRVVAEYKATSGTGYGELRRLIVYAGGRLLATEDMNATRETIYVSADRHPPEFGIGRGLPCCVIGNVCSEPIGQRIDL